MDKLAPVTSSAIAATAATQYPIVQSDNSLIFDGEEDFLDPFDPDYLDKKASQDQERQALADSWAKKFEEDFAKKATYLLRRFVNEPNKAERKKIFDESSKNGFIDHMMDTIEKDVEAFPRSGKNHYQEEFYDDLEKTAAEIRDQGVRFDSRRDAGNSTTAAPTNSTTTASGGNNTEQKKNIGIGTGAAGGAGLTIAGFLKYWCGGGNRNGRRANRVAPAELRARREDELAARATADLLCCCVAVIANVFDREPRRRVIDLNPEEVRNPAEPAPVPDTVIDVERLQRQRAANIDGGHL